MRRNIKVVCIFYSQKSTICEYIYNAYSNIIAKKKMKKKIDYSKNILANNFYLFLFQKNIHYIQVLDKVDHGH